MSQGIDINKKFANVAPPKKHENLVTLFADLPALDCLTTLNQYNIMSAPVFEDKDKKSFIGIVDLLDLCSYALSVVDTIANAADKDAAGSNWKMIFENGLRQKNAKELVNFSKSNYCWPLGEKASFKEILDNLSSKGVHRVPLLKQDGSFLRLVTQSEVLRFVSQHLDDFGTGLDKSVLMAGLVGKGTIYVKASQTVLEAFKAIIEKKISAVAVLDDKQRLIGNISVRDLRTVIKDIPELKLKSTIGAFLKDIQGGEVRPPITVGATSTVRSAITKLTSSGIHRVYVVDEHQYPQGILFPWVGFNAAPTRTQGDQQDAAPVPEIVTPEQAAQKIGVDLTKNFPKDHHLTILDDEFKSMFPEFKSDDELFFVLGDGAAEDVVKVLREKKVACVPILDPVKKVDNEPRVQGLADVTDIAAFVFGLDKDSKHQANEKVSFEELHTKKLKGVSAKDVINVSGLNQAAILGVQTRLMDVFSALTIPSVHRVPVMSLESERTTSASPKKKAAIGKFVTQTQVLGFIATHLEAFGPVLEKSIVAARVGVFKPKYVTDKVTALEGFRTLVKECCSGLPVVDDNFKVVGSLSTTDLRLVVLSNPSVNINKPITEFWEDVKADTTYTKPGRMITCSYMDTVHQVITKLQSNQVHRLFITDERGLLLGIVSLSDVLKYILRTGSQY